MTTPPWQVLDGAPAPPAGRAAPGRYAAYRLADYLLERGILTALFGVVIVVAPAVAVGVRGATAAALLVTNVGTLATLATLFAVNGISSTDRQRGYFRMLFSKPVRVPAYYLADYLVRAGGVLLVAGTVLAGFAALTASSFAWWALAQVGLVYLLVGGVGFLLSAITQRDGVALVLVYVLTFLLRGAAALAAGAPAAAAAAAVRVLPPFHLLDALRDALAAGTAPAVGDLVWVLSYALGCLAAGLLVLRIRPLSS